MADLSISKEQGDTSVSPHHSTSIDHIETTRNEKGSGNDHDELVPDNFAVTASELPKGYFYSSYFLGTWFATGMSIASAWAGFAYVLPILTQINEDIGPDANIVWVALVYTLGLSVGLVLVGRITDIFGRRWFFIAASGLGLLGSIICATAKNVPTLIGGEALIGLGGSAGLSYSLILGELVPMKYRFMISATIYIFAIPTNCLGAAIATAFVLYTKEGWRWSYYICIICNATAVISWVLFYHPPNFEMKWHATSKRSVIKSFDYVGSVLFTAGLVVFLIGLFWGGTVYPWNSAAVICSIILGFLCLVSFVFYEAYAPLKQPLVPIRLFKNTGYVASVLLLGLAASVYYAFSLLFPQMVYILYSTSDPMWAGWISCLVGAGISLGEIVGGTICEKIGNVRYQCIVAVTIGGIFLAAGAACTVDSPKTAIALVSISSFAIGYNEAIAFPLCTICIDDQRDIGVAAGVAGSVRSIIATFASTIYQVVLSARLRKTIPSIVPAALVAAGLPGSSVPGFITALSTGNTKALQALEGFTPAILGIGARAYKVANADAYRTVFLVSIGFSVLATLSSFFIPNVDDLMTMEVTTTLHSRKDHRVVGAERTKIDTHGDAAA